MAEPRHLCMSIYCPNRMKCEDWFVNGLDCTNIIMRDYFSERGCEKQEGKKK